MNEPITKFDGKYKFLSNFYPSNVVLDGMHYSSIEHAYQASKSTSKIIRDAIRASPTPGKAKRAGQKVQIRPDWEQVKLSVMEDLVNQKFQQEQLKSMLLETGAAHLEEGNFWQDIFWGTCNGVGQNHLGKILMKVRDELK